MLIIKQEWLYKILHGEKTVEIRSRAHSKCEWVYLMESKTGMVRALAYIGVSRVPTAEDASQHLESLAAMSYLHPHVWPLHVVRVLSRPWVVPVSCRKHCVTWVPRAKWALFEVVV